MEGLMKLGSRELMKERPESKYWFISPRGSLGGAEEMRHRLSSPFRGLGSTAQPQLSAYHGVVSCGWVRFVLFIPWI